MLTTELPDAPGILVAVGDRDRLLAAGPVHPADAAQAATLPRWRAEQFLAARTLLRRLLADLASGAADLELAYRPGGRPYLPARPELGVSVAHDGDRVAAAAGRCAEVGIDVQAAPARPSAGLLRRCLHQHADRLHRLDDAARGVELAWVWTVQEACVKAAGAGLAGRPWAIDVPPGQLSGRWGRYAWRTLRDRWAIPVSCAYATPGGSA